MTKSKTELASNQFFVPHNVLEDAKFLKMRKSSQMLYIHLCRLNNRLKKSKKDLFYRGIETLMSDTNMSKRVIKKAKAELVENKFIDVKRDCYVHGGARSADRFLLNGYRFKDETVW